MPGSNGPSIAERCKLQMQAIKNVLVSRELWRLCTFTVILMCFLASCAATWTFINFESVWLAMTLKSAITTTMLIVALGMLIGIDKLADDRRAGDASKELPVGGLKYEVNILDVLKRLDDHIKFEFDLTAQRTTFLAISESFLFGVYATALTALKDKSKYSEAHAATIESLVHVIPIIGLFISGVVFAAVVCACSMIFKLKERRTVYERLAQHRYEVHRDIGWRSLENFVGLLPPVVISGGFFIAWIFAWPKG